LYVELFDLLIAKFQ